MTEEQIYARILLVFIEQVYREGYELYDGFDATESYVRQWADGETPKFIENRSADKLGERTVDEAGIHIDRQTVRVIYITSHYVSSPDRMRSYLPIIANLLLCKKQYVDSPEYAAIIAHSAGYQMVNQLADRFLVEE